MSNKLDTKTIYEIFRACRLCGAGGGYKMPIIPSAVGFDCADIELQQKIRECLQLEVHQDDKMPPLVCELCVDKVNDFFEFLEMCRQTNQRTRQRLGLPMTVSQAASEDNCILGVTEPVYTQPSDEENHAHRIVRPVKVRDDKAEKKAKTLKKELENLVNLKESHNARQIGPASRDSKDSSTSISSRRSIKVNERDTSLNRLKSQKKNEQIKPSLKRERETKPTIITIDDDDDSDSALAPRAKKARLEKPPVEPKVDKPKPDAKPQKLLKPGTKILKSKPEKKTPKPESKLLKLKSDKESPKPESKILRSKPEKETPKTESKSLRLKPEKEILKPESKSLKLKPGKNTKKEKNPPVVENKIKSKIKYQDSPPSSPEPAPAPAPVPVPAPRTRPGPKSSKRAASPPPQPPKSLQSVTKHSAKPQRLLQNMVRLALLPDSDRPVKSKPGPKSMKAGAGGGGGAGRAGRQCGVCGLECLTAGGLAAHTRLHTVRPTNPTLACNPCGEWFLTPEETTAHHKWHKHKHVSYACRACSAHFKQLKEYDQHMLEAGAGHVPWREVADVRCASCWRDFPTRPMLDAHQCAGADARPGGKCSKCKKYYHMQKNLKKHEAMCAEKKKEIFVSEPRVAASVRRRLLPMRVLISRCDTLLPTARPGSKKQCNVADLPPDFGLDPRSVYPYRPVVRVKREPLERDGMVSIRPAVREELYKEEEYVHWDSDNSSDSDSEFSLVTVERIKKVPSLTALSLKTIYSRQCLGKVPKKLRKVKQDKFESLFNTEMEFDNVKSDIDSILDNLGLDDNDGFAKTIENNKIVSSDSLSEAEKITGLFNYDSDTLLDIPGSDKSKENDLDAAKTTVIDKDGVVNSVGNHDDGNVTDASINENNLDASMTADNGSEVIDKDAERSSVGNHDDGNVTDASINENNLDASMTADNGSEVIDKDAERSSVGNHDDGNVTDASINENNLDASMTADNGSEVIDKDAERSSVGDHDDGNVTDASLNETETKSHSDVPKDEVNASVGNNDDGNATDAFMNEAELKSNSDVFKDNIDENIIDNSFASLLGTANNIPIEDKTSALEDSLSLENNITEKVNNDCDTDKVNGTTDSNDLISEINELYDRKIMEELDAEIGI